jgi:hypothetical protein
MTDENPQRTARVQHIDRGALDELRTALEREGSGLSLQAIDVIDYVGHLTSARAGLRDELRKALDSTLAKDFLALYQAARMLTAGWVPLERQSVVNADVEGLALHVRRLAPLYDDVRMRLNLRSQVARDAARTTLAGPLPFVLQGAVLAPPGQPRRSEVDPSTFGDLREAEDEMETEDECSARTVREEMGAALTLAPPHTVRVMRVDGSTSLECDHTFQDTRHCLHCGKSGAELVRESRAEARNVAEVRLELGPTLLPRITALVDSGRLGRDLQVVVQTLFVLGMLDAEGHEPLAHVGEPKSHVSAEAMFVRFALPHEDAPQRAAVLRQLLLDLAEWFDETDPLRPALLAALERLPRT